MNTVADYMLGLLDDAIMTLKNHSGVLLADMVIVTHENNPIARQEDWLGIPWYHDTACPVESIYVLQKRDYDRTWKP